MKCVVFGCGKYFRRYINCITKLDVVAVVDNDVHKQGKRIGKYCIQSPEVLRHLEFERIYICVMNCNEIRVQLISMQVKEEKIYYFFDLEQEGNVDFYLKNSLNGNGKRAVLLSHDFSVSGAPKCLLAVARYLHDSNYHVIVGSPEDGQMKNEFWKTGADVCVDKRLGMGDLSSIEWVQDCEVLFINSLVLYYLLRRRDLNIPVMWWIHEPPELCGVVIPERFSEICFHNMSVYSVSSVADKALCSIVPDIHPRRLLFEVEDCSTGSKEVVSVPIRSEVINMVIIGGITKLKGQDVLAEALSRLEERDREHIQVYAVGKDSTVYAEMLKKRVEEQRLPIYFAGELAPEETLAVMHQCEVVICASRIETMSRSIAEALMLRKVVIVSDNCGIAEYIQDGVDGFIFASEDAAMLAEKLHFVLHHVIDRGDTLVSANGRKVYEKHFSRKCFYTQMEEIFLYCENCRQY